MMGHVARASIIRAPVEAVWNALNDIDHTPQWVEGLVDAKLNMPGPYGVGSAYTDYNKIGPINQVTLWRVTVFEPITRQIHVSESKVLPTTMTLNLAPANGGTRIEQIVDYHFLPQLGPLGRLLENLLMNRMIGQVLAKNQANLDWYLNGGALAQK